MSVSEELYKLVERFDQGYEAYKSKEYSEAQVRVDFINPLLVLLGWDVDNAQGRPEAYRDVIYEDRVKVGGGTKAPDYGFYTGGARRFFLEAKKPSVDLQNDVNPSVQLRRYAWSAKLPLSILTDFEEFAFYDCRFEPMKNDRPTTARLDFLTYDQYPDRWDDIYGVFSREAVLSGSFDKYAASTERRRGVDTVNTAFLREIESWREALAQDIALKNNLSRRQLNYAVQMTIDRIIFLRMAEDRGVEDYGRLLGNVDGSGVYERMCNLFRDADDRYNSGLFHFRKERGRNEEPDEFTTSLAIDDAVLQRIVRGLYYPESPYEFSVLPLDVLGQVYEQFLGKVIHLEDGNRATVEEKPEVRKAGGVYYTPTYIVDYIVENTVGKLLEDKRPGPRGGARKLKIVDPACGSGSFLIGAYEYLLDWHRDRYLEDGPEKHPKEIYEGPGGKYHLTIDEKKRILLNNIYGVDIDPQAVEVTKLSLLLKVLEGESGDSITRQLSLIQERALPDLDNNIKCGNSLIKPDFYDEQDLYLFTEEDEYRINVFDWHEAFPQVFEGNGSGFDAVIGNPPYLNAVEERTRFSGELKAYVKDRFRSARGAFDSSILFQELGIRLTISGGRTSFIVPNKFLSAPFGKAFRNLAVSKTELQLLANFSEVDVFDGVGVYPVIYVLKPSENPRNRYKVELQTFQSDQDGSHNLADSRTVVAEPSQVSTWTQMFSAGIGLLDRVESTYPKVGELYEVAASASAGEAYEIKPCLVDSKPEEESFAFVTSGAIDRYYCSHSVKDIRYLKSKYIAPYLPESCKALSKNRKRQYSSEKLIFAGMTKRLEAIWDDGRIAGAVPTVQILCKSNGTGKNLKYELGVLNSKLFNWIFDQYFASLALAGGYLRVGVPQIKAMPIRTIDFTNAEDVARHKRMVGLVNKMLDLHKHLSQAKINQERNVIQRQIEATDRQIDKLVYELYDLNEGEIAVVTGATRANP